MANNTFHVGGKLFAASPWNTVGVKLSDLQEGDNVRWTARFRVVGRRSLYPLRPAESIA